MNRAYGEAEDFELTGLKHARTHTHTHSPTAAACPFNFKAADAKMAFISPQLNLWHRRGNLRRGRLFPHFPARDVGRGEADPFRLGRTRVRWPIAFF